MFDNETALKNASQTLNAALKDRDMAQRELARLTGDPVATISGLATGKHMPHLGVLARIAAVLGLSLDDFLRDSKRKRRPSPKTA